MRFILLTFFCYLSVSVSAQVNEFPLLEKIEEAQNNLATTETKISKQRHKLAYLLNILEKEVTTLRNKASIALRIADEKTLSLSTLEKRINDWRQQQNYQQNLLHRFLQKNNHGDQIPAQAEDRISATAAAAAILLQRLHPQWQAGNIIQPSGEVINQPTLSVGPVTWYWDTALQQAGIASLQNISTRTLQSDLLFSGSHSAAINALQQQGQGHIIFDPTLTRALTRQQNSENVIEHLIKGGLWAIPIVLFALFALSIALFKSHQLWRLPKLIRFTPSSLQSAIKDPSAPSAQRLKGMQKTLFDIAGSQQTSQQRDDQMFMQLHDDKHRLERWIGAIAITAAISPLLGLLGTVSGMIETFKMMTLFGSGDPEVVSGGIAQALVTTELGLVVAIPALILNAVLSRRAKSYYHELENFAILLSKVEEETQHD